MWFLSLAAVSSLPSTVNDRQVLLQLGAACGRGASTPLSFRGSVQKGSARDAVGPGRQKGGAAPVSPSKELVLTLFLPENRHSPPSGLPETFSPAQNLSQELSLPVNNKLLREGRDWASWLAVRSREDDYGYARLSPGMKETLGSILLNERLSEPSQQFGQGALGQRGLPRLSSLFLSLCG